MRSPVFTSCIAVTIFFSSLVSQRSEAVDFAEIARFELFSTSNSDNAQYIGSNPVAVAWSGSRLYVAGFNNSGADANTAVVEVLNAAATGVIAAPTFSAPLGGEVGTFDSSVIIDTPNARGYTGLAISSDGNSLLATHDFGLDDPQAIQVFNTSDGSQRWRIGEDLSDSNNVRGHAGGAFDPGFNGSGGDGSGVAFGFFGDGRRHLHDVTSGEEIHGATGGDSPGFIWIPPVPNGSFTREFDFDPDTGDLYVRHSNNLSKTTRTGENTSTDQVQIFTNQADFVNNQHLAFMSNTSDGDLIIFNDRAGAALTQNFFTVTKVVDTNGAIQTVNFTFLPGSEGDLDGDQDVDGNDFLLIQKTDPELLPTWEARYGLGPGPFTPELGAGWYDYDFDPTTQTLALLDSTNRRVHIFQVGSPLLSSAIQAVPEPSTCGLALVSLLYLGWRRKG